MILRNLVKSELVQMKLNVKRFYEVKYAMCFDRDSTPTEGGHGTPTYRNGVLEI